MIFSPPAAARPPLHLVDSEADMVSTLAWSARDRFPEVCEMLMEEIGRASLCGRSDLPSDVVSMAADVEYRDERSGLTRCVQLVYPNHADALCGRISILTPIGAGLIGVKAGDGIDWPDRDGRERRLAVLRVRQQPEA